MELTYTEMNGYLIPDLILPETDTRPIGKYGELRRQFLQEHRPDLFDLMLLEGTLHSHLADVDATARQMVEDTITRIARQQMELTKPQFGKTGGTVAFHAYQSFRPGEVTPEQCHAIGVELAKRVWGDRFQVLIATHLNTDCCHNHFVINSVSFVDGKRYNDCKKTYRALQDASDALCREQGLSVVDKKDTHRVPRNLYLAEKAGEPTRYNVMRRILILLFCAARRPVICPVSCAKWATRWTSIPTTNTRQSGCPMTAVPCASRRWERSTLRRQ